LRQEKVELEQTLEKEQEYQVNRLMRKIERLESETVSKQNTLEQVQWPTIITTSIKHSQVIITLSITNYTNNSKQRSAYTANL